MKQFTRNEFSPFAIFVELENFIRLVWIEDAKKKNKTFKLSK